jgi:hypothetical protein
MRLVYLPEGDPNEHQQFVPTWPASDHDEPDAELARQKIASGLYEDADAGVPDAKVSRIAKNTEPPASASSDAQETS